MNGASDMSRAEVSDDNEQVQISESDSNANDSSSSYNPIRERTRQRNASRTRRRKRAAKKKAKRRAVIKKAMKQKRAAVSKEKKKLRRIKKNKNITRTQRRARKRDFRQGKLSYGGMSRSEQDRLERKAKESNERRRIAAHKMLEARAKKRFFADQRYVEKMKKNKECRSWKGVFPFIPGRNENEEVERILKLHGWHEVILQRALSGTKPEHLTYRQWYG